MMIPLDVIAKRLIIVASYSNINRTSKIAISKSSSNTNLPWNFHSLCPLSAKRKFHSSFVIQLFLSTTH